MSTEEIAEGIRFVVDVHGKVTSVVLAPQIWQHIVARLEDAEDRALLSDLAPSLARGPKGAIRWAEVERDWA